MDSRHVRRIVGAGIVAAGISGLRAEDAGPVFPDFEPVTWLAVTAPRVPLLNSAGIVGLAAMRPNGKGPRLMVRVMASRAAPDPAAR